MSLTFAGADNDDGKGNVDDVDDVDVVSDNTGACVPAPAPAPAPAG